MQAILVCTISSSRICHGRCVDQQEEADAQSSASAQLSDIALSLRIPDRGQGTSEKLSRV